MRRPRSNGFIERVRRTLLEERLRPSGRTKESLEAVQADLETHLGLYSTQRPHRGRGMRGETPGRAFLAHLPQPITPPREEVAEAT